MALVTIVHRLQDPSCNVYILELIVDVLKTAVKELNTGAERRPTARKRDIYRG